MVRSETPAAAFSIRPLPTRSDCAASGRTRNQRHQTGQGAGNERVGLGEVQRLDEVGRQEREHDVVTDGEDDHERDSQATALLGRELGPIHRATPYSPPAENPCRPHDVIQAEGVGLFSGEQAVELGSDQWPKPCDDLPVAFDRAH